MASKHKRANSIPQIEMNGTMYSDQKIKGEAFFQYYKELMGKQSPQIPQIHWPNLYTQRHSLTDLTQPIMMEEIHQVIQSWPNNKTPGPDGFTGEFYKKYVLLLALDILRVLTHVTENNLMLSPLNSSHVVLILKKENASNPQDYRPISLIHGIQRIFSKILALRLQPRIAELVDTS